MARKKKDEAKVETKKKTSNVKKNSVTMRDINNMKSIASDLADVGKTAQAVGKKLTTLMTRLEKEYARRVGQKNGKVGS